MKRNHILIGILFALLQGAAYGQEPVGDGWDLNRCISYALDNSIQVSKVKLDVLSSQSNLTRAKASRLPSLSASVAQNVSNSKYFSTPTADGEWDMSASTSASLSSSLTLYNGGNINASIKQSALNVELAELNVDISKNSIVLLVTQGYLNALYSNESLSYAKEVLASSEKQLTRAMELHRAGSMTKSDLAQIEAQYANDTYSLVVAQSSLVTSITELKQLLEIPVTDTFSVAFPEVEVQREFIQVPSKHEAFATALSIMPEIKGVEKSKAIASLDLDKAKSGYLPSLTLNASYATNYSDASSGSFGTQLTNNQNQRVGLTLSIPIFSKYQTKNAVEISRISIDRANLTAQETQKNLLQKVETVYQNVISGKSRYDAAVQQNLSAAESYRLSEEQFNLGMINTVELLKAKTQLLSAQKDLVQAKYSLILNKKILDFYMGQQISL